jgi:hypothetical protein
MGLPLCKRLKGLPLTGFPLCKLTRRLLLARLPLCKSPKGLPLMGLPLCKRLKRLGLARLSLRKVSHKHERSFAQYADYPLTLRTIGSLAKMRIAALPDTFSCTLASIML